MIEVPFKVICDVCMKPAEILAAVKPYEGTYEIHIACHGDHQRCRVGYGSTMTKKAFLWSDLESSFQTKATLLNDERDAELRLLMAANDLAGTRAVLFGKGIDVCQQSIGIEWIDRVVAALDDRLTALMKLTTPTADQARYELWERAGSNLIELAGKIKP